MSQDLACALGVKQTRNSASFTGVGEASAVPISAAADIRIAAQLTFVLLRSRKAEPVSILQHLLYQKLLLMYLSVE